MLDDYYGQLDTLVGRAPASLDRQDLLLVASGFGMEPLTLGKRMLERLAGNVRFSGTPRAGAGRVPPRVRRRRRAAAFNAHQTITCIPTYDR